MFASRLPERDGGPIPSPGGKESPGERASTPGRIRAASFQQSGAYNTTSVRKNGQHPPTLPPRSSLPAPPPPNDPPPNNPPPRPPHERDEKASRGGSNKPGLGRPSTPPKRPQRPASELMLMPVQESSLRHIRPIPDRAVTTSRPKPRGESPLRQMMTTIHQSQRFLQKELPPSPAASPKEETCMRKSSPSTSQASSISITRPSLTEESVDVAAAPMVRDERGSSSTTTSFSTVPSAYLPSSVFRTSQKLSSIDRAVSLASLRRSASVRRNTVKRNAYSLDAHSNGTSSFLKRRAQAAINIRAAMFDGEESDRRPKCQSRVAKSVKTNPPQTSGRKKRKGETMSILIDDGFFPVEELVYRKRSPTTNRYTSMAGLELNLPPRLSFIEKNTPQSPISPSTPNTPTTPRDEASETSLTPLLSARNQRYAGYTNLSQISESEDIAGEVKAAISTAQTSAVVPPQAKDTWQQPLSILVAPVVATQIQLRNGSIVTLTPPELTAWRPTIYLHGPIMLPKPNIMPRKNSVASLDPFQDVVEKLYQDSLVIPRRRSDDAVTDDICEFFDGFGFDPISFAGDRLFFFSSEMDLGVGEVSNVELDLETFSTPPMEPARMEAMNALDQRNSLPPPALQAPPVDNQDTLRARGIARLQSHAIQQAQAAQTQTGPSARRESITLGKPQGSAVLPFLPGPETSMLDAVLLRPTQQQQQQWQQQHDVSYSANVYGQRHPDAAYTSRKSRENHPNLHTTMRTWRSGGKGDDRVEEEEEEAWKGRTKPVVAAAAAAGKESSSLSRMRRLVATASSML